MKYVKSIRSPLNSLCFALLLSLALIIGQWSGYAHRLQHLTTVVGSTVTLSTVIASKGHAVSDSNINSSINSALNLATDPTSNALLSTSPPSYEALLHSCLLIDAATLADGVSQVVAQFTPLEFDYPYIQFDATASWQALLRLAFLSRAPPSFSLPH